MKSLKSPSQQTQISPLTHELNYFNVRQHNTGYIDNQLQTKVSTNDRTHSAQFSPIHIVPRTPCLNFSERNSELAMVATADLSLTNEIAVPINVL